MQCVEVNSLIGDILHFFDFFFELVLASHLQEANVNELIETTHSVFDNLFVLGFSLTQIRSRLTCAIDLVQDPDTTISRFPHTALTKFSLSNFGLVKFILSFLLSNPFKVLVDLSWLLEVRISYKLLDL